MYEGDGVEKTGNEKLDYEILRWINNRMIELIDLYIDLGDGSGWDEDYLMCCFPRSFLEDNFALCKRIILDIKDILASDIIYANMRLLYKYVLFGIVTYEMEIINNAIDDGYENVLPPIDVELVKEIYKAKEYEYNSKLTREMIEDENHPIHFIDFLQSEEYFYEVIFDDTELDTDYCDRIVLSCIEKIENKEWQPYDITEVLELASRPIKEQYYKVAKKSNNLNLPDELFIVQEIDNIIKLLCNRITDIRKLTENEISNYIEYMLKRLLVLNRDIQIEREALLGFSNVKIGEADMVLYRNNDRGYNNIAVIENKMYNTQFKEIKQLLGYMNIHVKPGITITINKKKRLIDVIEALKNYIESEKNNLHIVQVDKKKEYLLHTTMKNQQDDTMVNCYHFVLSLNDEEHERWAKEIRNM